MSFLYAKKKNNKRWKKLLRKPKINWAVIRCLAKLSTPKKPMMDCFNRCFLWADNTNWKQFASTSLLPESISTWKYLPINTDLLLFAWPCSHCIIWMTCCFPFVEKVTWLKWFPFGLEYWSLMRINSTTQKRGGNMPLENYPMPVQCRNLDWSCAQSGFCYWPLVNWWDPTWSHWLVPDKALVELRPHPCWFSGKDCTTSSSLV